MSKPPCDADFSAWPCVHATADGAVLDVSVVPGATRTEAVGLHGGALRLRLAAPPIDGKANEALVVWLADELQCAKREVHLLRGISARRKQVAVDLPIARVVAWLTKSVPPR